MSIRLNLEGVRCFATKQRAVIRPLTLLVGENSSGKSTFLAFCRIAPTIMNFPHIVNRPWMEVPFNEPPFMLGAYDQIASHHGGRAGRAKSFSVGLESDVEGGRVAEMRATFVSVNGQPAISVARLSVGNLSCTIREANTKKQSLTLEGSIGRGEMKDNLFPLNPNWAYVYRFLEMFTLAPSEKFETTFSEEDMQLLFLATQQLGSALGIQPYAFAPIRTSPQRTYDPVAAEPKPEGSHVPMVLSELSHGTAQKTWTSLQSGLRKFGKRSGLFEQIKVIRKGKKDSDPFQIEVTSGGPPFNLLDVGYGVSQVLPILVDTLRRSERNDVFLLQQPEIHLHPRAQAELGSFFAGQVTAQRRFIIETHSDYLVDRVRTEVRKGRISPEDVSLLYFERLKSGAKIHNLELDKSGSIVSPPKGYRQFFLDEDRRLLGD